MDLVGREKECVILENALSASNRSCWWCMEDAE